MSLEYYFNNCAQSNNSIAKKNENKRNVGNKTMYTTQLGKYVNANVIDTLQYGFMMDFLKTKGTICHAKKYYNIKRLINSSSINEKSKNKFNKACNVLFKHLHSIFEDNINANTNDNINIDKFIEDIEQSNEDVFIFTNDQKNSIHKMCQFLYDPDMRVFGLYGYAGTGKTTTSTKFIHHLLNKNYIRSVVFTAPTNKAVNILKSKFRNDLDDLAKNKLHTEINNMTLEDILGKFDEIGYKIQFMTTHKLLNYKNDFDIEGERVFIKGDKSTINDYDLVVIDEASMLNLTMTIHIFEEVYKNHATLKVDKSPKVLFIGDPAQLPPVHERISVLFAKNNNDFNFNLYKKAFINNHKNNGYNNMENDVNLTNLAQAHFDKFKEHILNMHFMILKEIMRSADNNVIGICNETRSAVLKEIDVPKCFKFKGQRVFLYKYNGKTLKTNTEWFKKAVEYFSSTNNNHNVSNIILAWRNKQTENYNNTMRKIIFKKEVLNQFEIGDILTLNEFYNMNDTRAKETNNKNIKGKKKNDTKGGFHTSEQIKITDIEHVIKSVEEFTENLTGLGNMKNANDIREKYIKEIKLINKTTVRKYNVWKLYVQKLSDLMADNIPETYQIYVIKNEHKDLLVNDRTFVANRIKELRNYYKNIHKENINSIDGKVIKQLWKELNNKLFDPFANVNISFSISTHKSQSSTFYNVFVDVDDILKNPDRQEALHCLYTAETRTANELHLLI